MAEFFAMGGYAAYVWPAYVVSVLVLAVATVLSLQAHTRARRSVRQLEQEGGEAGEDSG